MQIGKPKNDGLEVSAIGFGCMGLNFSYGHSLRTDDAIKLIRDAASEGHVFRHR